MRNFFIVGVQKAGTTALHACLSDHSQLKLSTPKELHFFDEETIDWQAPPYENLKVMMGHQEGEICGEATPIYMYWPGSIERIKAFDPAARLIVLLRHPVFRAFSHWNMETILGKEDLPFSDAIRSGRARVRTAENSVHRIFSYVERGLYAAQIRRIFRHFPHQQVHFATTEDFRLSPTQTFGAIERFLGVEEMLQTESEYTLSESPDARDPLSQEDKAYLLDIFSKDIQETSDLTGLALDAWLDATYREPQKRHV